MSDAPVLRTDGKIEFASAEALQKSFALYLSKGGVLVQEEQPLTSFTTLELTLVSGLSPRKVHCRAEAMCHAGADLFLRFVDFGEALAQELSDFAHAVPLPPSAPVPVPPPPSEPSPPASAPSPPPSAPSPPPSAPSPPPSAPILAPPSSPSATQHLAVPSSGTFKNPTQAKDFLQVPVARTPTAAELSLPSMPLVLRMLAARKQPCVRLHVKAANRDLELFVTDDGRALMPVSDKTLVAGFAEAEGTFEFETAKAPAVHYKATLRGLRVALLKELVKRFTEADLESAMAPRLGLSPRIDAHGAQILLQLALSDAQIRIGKRMLNGEYALDEVLYTGIGVRSTYQLLFLLEVNGALEWADPPPKTSLVVEEMSALLQRIRGADHFTVLGLHLSSAPRVVATTYERLEKMYGPGGAAAQQSPQLAGELWALMERAYAVVRSSAGRKAYRAEAFGGVRLEYAAALAYDQALLAELRRQWQQSIDLLETTLELSPHADAVTALRRVRENEAAWRRAEEKAGLVHVDPDE